MNNTTGENIHEDLVRQILLLTEEQRYSSYLQSICQYTYCKFFLNDFVEPNATCYVSSERLVLSADHPSEANCLRNLFSDFIRIYIYPIFIVLGILGNSLSCLIMFLNIRRNGCSANLYLTLLAFVDCLFILGSALPEWLAFLHSTLNFQLRSQFLCRFVYWFGNFMTHLSAGLVISVTVERFIAIKYPLIAHKIHAIKHTHLLLVTLTVFFFLLDSRLFFLLKHLPESIHIVSTCSNYTEIRYERHEIIACGVGNHQHVKTWIFVDFCVYTLIPFLVIITLNSLIIHRLIIAQRKRQRMLHVNHSTNENEKKTLAPHLSDNPQVIHNHKFFYLRRCRSIPERSLSAVMLRPPFNYFHARSSFRQSNSSNESTGRPRSWSGRQRLNSSNTRLTILLLSISGTFLVLTLPAVVLNLIISFELKSDVPTFETSIDPVGRDLHLTAKIYYTIGRLLMIMNHSTNFLLYFVVGKRFRRDLKLLCLGHWRHFVRQ